MLKSPHYDMLRAMMLTLCFLIVSCESKSTDSTTSINDHEVSEVRSVDGSLDDQGGDGSGGSGSQMDMSVHSEMGNEGNAQVGGQRGDQGGSTHSGLTPPFDQRAVGLQTDHDITHDGQARKFHFFVPPDVSDQDTYPLVILLHGHGGSSDQILGLTGVKAPYKVWLDVAAREKIFLLVPEGVTSPDGKLGWHDCRGDTATNPSTDDVGLIVKLATAMAETYPIDENRMYASGTSNGGHMSLRLAIEAGETFAAIAPVVAAMPKNSKCSQPDTQVALMLLSGTNDAILPYDGGQMPGGRGEVLSAVDTITFWKNLNQNTSTATVENLPDINTLDASTVIRSSYFGETQIQEVVLITMDGAGHTEPSIAEQFSGVFEAIVGRQNHDVEMAELVWEFFKDKTR